MGVLNWITGENGGIDCQEDPESGGLYCRKFKAKGGTKIATGSEAIMSVEPKSCKAHFTNRYSVLEEDEPDFERMAKKLESACKGGIQ